MALFRCARRRRIVNAFPLCDAGPGQSGDVGDTLMFDGSLSSDPGGAIVQFDWDFGDGGGFMNDLGATPGHQYNAANLFTVTLRITDDDGAVSMCTTTAGVNAFPLCDAGLGQSGEVGDTLMFDGLDVERSGRSDRAVRLGLR